MAFASLESTSRDWRGVMILSAPSKGFDMSQEATSKFAQFRGSPLARRIGSVVLGAWIVLYLAVITDTSRIGSLPRNTLRCLSSSGSLVFLPWGYCRARGTNLALEIGILPLGRKSICQIRPLR